MTCGSPCVRRRRINGGEPIRVWARRVDRLSRVSAAGYDSQGFQAATIRLPRGWCNIWYRIGWRFHVYHRQRSTARLFPLIDEVNGNGAAVEIVAKKNRAYLVPAAEYEALEETAHLLRSPANMRRLIVSYQHALEGRHEIRALVNPDDQS